MLVKKKIIYMHIYREGVDKSSTSMVIDKLKLFLII